MVNFSHKSQHLGIAIKYFNMLICINEHGSFMQIQKDDIRKNVLIAAREEFLNKGFKDSNMRTIAKKSKVGLSNIYNYFKDKNEIFIEVLAPLTNELDKLMLEHNNPKNITIDYFTSDKHQIKHINQYLELIINYKDELNLLFFKSYGSSFENFRDEYTDRHTKAGVEYIDKMKEKYPYINSDISEFFLHTMSSWWFSIIGEIVSHDLSNEVIKKFISEFMEFGTAGWKKIMKV